MRDPLSAAAFILSTMIALAAGCSSADEDCVAGKVCECADCNKTCGGGGGGGSCSFTCTGGRCSFDCPGGGCEITAANAAAVSVSCAGGRCSLSSRSTKSSTLSCSGNGCEHTCIGATSCKTLECKSGCQTTCGGAATCESSCTPLAGGCQVDESGVGSGSGTDIPDIDELIDGGRR